MGTTTRRIAVALAAAGLLVTVGCAKDETVTASSTTAPVTASTGGGSGTTEAPDDTLSDEDRDELCDRIDELNEADDSDISGVADLILEIRNMVPAEQTDDWDVLFDAFVELADLEPSGSEDEAEAIVTDPDFVDAADRIDAYAEDECDIDLGLGQDELAPTTDDTSTAPIDPRLDDPDLDPDADPTSIDAVQGHLESAYGTEAWWPDLDDATSWNATGTGGVVEWTITLSLDRSRSLPVSEMVKACDAIADYLVTYETDDVSVTIEDAGNGVLAVREADEEACSTP